MKWSDWFNEKGPWQEIPDEIGEYNDEQRDAMWDGLQLLLIVAAVGAAIVFFVPETVLVVVAGWMTASFLLISRPAIYDRIQRNKENLDEDD